MMICGQHCYCTFPILLNVTLCSFSIQQLGEETAAGSWFVDGGRIGPLLLPVRLFTGEKLLIPMEPSSHVGALPVS